MKEKNNWFPIGGNKECPACKALRKGTTWIGKPPKCAKHRRKVKMEYYS